MMTIIEEVRKIILKYARPNRIYLYGSRVNGEAGKSSDIDIAYDDPVFKDHYLIEDEVGAINTFIKIDVKNIAHCEPRFRNRVISTGRVIYSANKKMRAEDGLYNFSKAFSRFSEVVERYDEFKAAGYGDIYLDLLVKRFEFTYEMGWKALKRCLEYLGIEVKNPRESFKEGFSQGLLDNETIWLDMIEFRNILSHVYDETDIAEIIEKKEIFKDEFARLKNALEKLLGDQEDV